MLLSSKLSLIDEILGKEPAAGLTGGFAGKLHRTNNVPSTALNHDEKFVPVMLATSALRVRAVVVVGM